MRIGELRHVKALGGGGRDSIVGRRGTLTKTGPALSRKRSTFVQYSTQNPPEIGPARKQGILAGSPGRSVPAGQPDTAARARSRGAHGHPVSAVRCGAVCGMPGRSLAAAPLVDTGM